MLQRVQLHISEFTFWLKVIPESSSLGLLPRRGTIAVSLPTSKRCLSPLLEGLGIPVERGFSVNLSPLQEHLLRQGFLVSFPCPLLGFGVPDSASISVVRVLGTKVATRSLEVHLC